MSDCNNHENEYQVAFPGANNPSNAPVWIDQTGAQSGKKTMLIWNEGPKKCQMKSYPGSPPSNFAYGQGQPIWPGMGLVIRNINASIRHYFLCNGSDTCVLYIMEVTP